MKFTLSWLKQHLETDAGLDEIVERLTMLGLEVEGVEDRGKGLEGFAAARVLEARQHPNADRLRVCTVETAEGTVEVVCGAPNARTGLIGVFAASGAYIPGLDSVLKKAAIRGVESNGMLLSERELGISDEHTGIIELPESVAVGTPAAAAMGLDDPVIDIAITPNRGDCLGIRGVARDLAAAGLGSLKPLDQTPVPGTFESPINVQLEFKPAAKDACPYFVGRYIRGVKNVESPQWLKERLLSIGLRPISALVDITNLMTIEHCRPLHVFDADKVRGDIRARLARRGETLQALNGKEYYLDPEMTVIADNRGPEALGGVMGGEPSGCTETTVNVFVESALFDPVRTAATGRKLGLQSDARYRFERGIDPAFLVGGMEIATRLILEICGGEASNLVVAGGEPNWHRKIRLRSDRVRSLGGVDVPSADIERILKVLGFAVEAVDGGFEAVAPSWRNDIVGEADLVEEVMRVYGYDKIPTVPMERESALPQQALDAGQRSRVLARRVLAGRGMIEAVTYSFLSSDLADLFGGVSDDLRLSNPISSELDVMRPSLLPNLIAACGRNADRGQYDGALFEVGPQFAGHDPEDQEMVAAGARAGDSGPRHWSRRPRPVDVFDAKADALAVLAAVGLPVDRLQTLAEAPAWYHPGRSGTLCLGPKNVLACFGEVHPGVLAKMGVKGPVAGFEVFIERLPKRKAKNGATRPLLVLSPFQPVERDFAFVVDADVSAEAVMRAARGADKALIAEVRLFDVFAGKGVGEGKKSLAVSVTLQPTEETLTDAGIDAVAQKIIAAVGKATGGVLRA